MPIKSTTQYKTANEELFALYAENNDQRVRNRIVELNLGLVKKEASHWTNQCQENFDDLLQVGSLGLLRAIERFDIEKGFAFSSFALPYIRGEIQHYLRDKGYSVRIPRRCLELKNKANRVVRELREELKRQPNDHEIARKLGVSLGEWQEVKLAYRNREPLSLDAKTSQDEDRSTLGEMLPDSQYHSFQLVEEDKIRIQGALSQLEDTTRKVLEFVFLQDLTQKETAERLGLVLLLCPVASKKVLVA